jgi:L-aminopeptidase/D-esterase-like protein
MRWAVNRYASQDDGETIAGAISRAQAIAVCDGSYKDGFGTAAYVLEGDTSLNRLVAVNVVPGFTMDQ